jgi:hypothetical protein
MSGFVATWRKPVAGRSGAGRGEWLGLHVVDRFLADLPQSHVVLPQ